MQKKQKIKNKERKTISWKEMVCKIIITAMNKGQLPALSLASILFLISYRMPKEDLGKIILLILEKCVDLSLFGYFLAFLFLIYNRFAKYCHRNNSFIHKIDIENML